MELARRRSQRLAGDDKVTAVNNHIGQVAVARAQSVGVVDDDVERAGDRPGEGHNPRSNSSNWIAGYYAKLKASIARSVRSGRRTKEVDDLAMNRWQPPPVRRHRGDCRRRACRLGRERGDGWRQNP